MTPPGGDTFDLDAECETFCRYLVGESPGAQVKARYRRAHELGVVAPPAGISPRDVRLVRAARRGGGWARAADVHARFFAPGGWLRRKLVLLLALLETDGPGRRWVDEVESSTAGWLVRMTGAGLGFGVLLVLGWFWFGWSSRRPAGDAS